MKFFLQKLIFLLTWLTTFANTTPPAQNLTFQNYSFLLSTAKNQKPASEVKMGVENPITVGVHGSGKTAKDPTHSEKNHSLNTTSRESCVFAGTNLYANIAPNTLDHDALMAFNIVASALQLGNAIRNSYSTLNTSSKIHAANEIDIRAVTPSEADDFINKYEACNGQFGNSTNLSPELKNTVHNTYLKLKELRVVSGAGGVSALLAKWDNLTIAEAKSLYRQIAKTEIQGSKIVRTQSEILQEVQQRGITNPYNFAHTIEDITLTQDAFFVRAYNQNKTGRWLISIDDVDGFASVDDFIKKTALPVVDEYGAVLNPDKMAIVKVPAGTTIRKSVARPQDWGGQGHLPGGATQYEIIDFNWQSMGEWYKEMGIISDFIK